MNQPEGLVGKMPFQSDKALCWLLVELHSLATSQNRTSMFGVYGAYKFNHTHSGTLTTVKADV